MGKIIILVLLGGCVYGQQITGGGTGTGSATAAGATGDVQCKASNGNLAACGINDNGVTVAIPSRTLSVSGTVLRGGGTSLPGTCTIGDQYFLTTGTKGNYSCTATNTWTLPGPFAGTVSVQDFGAVADGIANDTAAIKAAIVSLTNGGTVYFPCGSYKVAETNGATITLTDGIHLRGASSKCARIVFTGAYTDSMLRSASRDDNNVNAYITVGVSDLELSAENVATVALLDLTGMRMSTFERLYLAGNGTQIAMLLSDENPAGTSSKSCFFNLLKDIDGTGIGWATWIKIRSLAGNVNHATFLNHSAQTHNLIDLADTVVTGLAMHFLDGYFSSDSGMVFPAAQPQASTFQNWDTEGFDATVIPPIRHFAYIPVGVPGETVYMGSSYGAGHLQMGAYHLWEDASGNLRIKNSAPSSGADGTIVGPLQAQYSTFSCQPGLGDGLNAIPVGTYLETTCLNDTGVTVTITAIKCFSDNAGSSTLMATNGAGTALLTSAVTCSASFAAGTQSATTTIAANDYVKFTFVSDGASKQTTWAVTEKK